MRQKHALALLFVFALGVALVLVWSRGRRSSPASVDPATSASRPPETSSPGTEPVALEPVALEAEAERVSLAPETSSDSAASDTATAEHGPLQIEGLVTDENGTALAGAEVWTHDAETRCDANGRYSLRCGSRGRMRFVLALADGHEESRQTLSIPEGSSIVRADFRLGRAFQIRGRVVDEDGAPIEGAAVTTFHTERNVVESAIDGSFLLDHLERDRPDHSLYARKEGWVQDAIEVPTKGSLVEGIELVLRRGTRVDGYVLAPDGSPVPETALYIGFSPNAYNRLDAKTDETGAFEFPCVGAGSQTLVAQHEGFAPCKRMLDIPEDTPRLPSLMLELEPGHFIGGVVRDRESEPLAGVLVNGTQDGEYLDLAEMETGADGRFRLEGLPAKGAGIEFYARDFLRRETTLEVLDHDDLEIVLEHAARVAGRVVDAVSGAPIESFTIRFVAPALQAGESRGWGFNSIWSQEGRGFTHPAGEWTSSGDQLTPGTVFGIEVRAKGYAPLRHYHVVARADFAPDDLVSALSGGGTVRGTLFDADGAPIADVKMRCRPEEDPFSPYDEDVHELGTTSTASDGSFEFTDVPSGPTRIAILPPDRPMQIDGPFDVPAGATVERTLRLGRGASIEGISLDAAGVPIGGSSLRIFGSPDGPSRGFSAVTTSDEQGRFAFRGLVADRYQVSRMLSDGHVDFDDGGSMEVPDVVAMVDVAVDERCSLRLEASGTCAVFGTIRASEGELPKVLSVEAGLCDATGAGVQLEGQTGRGTIAKDGSFRLENLPQGSWQVHVFCRRQGQMCAGSAAVELAEGEEREVTIELECYARR
jgi:protocatechuate 3,4-dioxygenase beta subunit